MSLPTEKPKVRFPISSSVHADGLASRRPERQRAQAARERSQRVATLAALFAGRLPLAPELARAAAELAVDHPPEGSQPAPLNEAALFARQAIEQDPAGLLGDRELLAAFHRYFGRPVPALPARRGRGDGVRARLRRQIQAAHPDAHPVATVRRPGESKDRGLRGVRLRPGWDRDWFADSSEKPAAPLAQEGGGPAAASRTMDAEGLLVGAEVAASFSESENEGHGIFDSGSRAAGGPSPRDVLESAPTHS